MGLHSSAFLGKSTPGYWGGEFNQCLNLWFRKTSVAFEPVSIPSGLTDNKSSLPLLWVTLGSRYTGWHPHSRLHEKEVCYCTIQSFVTENVSVSIAAEAMNKIPLGKFLVSPRGFWHELCVPAKANKSKQISIRLKDSGKKSGQPRLQWWFVRGISQMLSGSVLLHDPWPHPYQTHWEHVHLAAAEALERKSDLLSIVKLR